MKHLLLIVFCCLIVSSFALAQEKVDTAKAVVPPPEIEETPGIWNIVVLGGWTIPYEPDELKDEFKGSYNAGGGIAYLLPPGESGYGEVSLMLHYHNLSFNEADFRTAHNVPSTATVYGYEGDVYTGFAQFRGVFGKPNVGVGPYFTAGMGLYHIALPALGVEGQSEPLVEEYKKTTFGWSVGLGCDVAVTPKITLCADGKFVLGVTETNGHKLITAGAGIRYTL